MTNFMRNVSLFKSLVGTTFILVVPCPFPSLLQRPCVPFRTTMVRRILRNGLAVKPDALIGVKAPFQPFAPVLEVRRLSVPSGEAEV
jgi:hypothetical protein